MSGKGGPGDQGLNEVLLSLSVTIDDRSSVFLLRLPMWGLGQAATGDLRKLVNFGLIFILLNILGKLDFQPSVRDF